MRLLLCNDHLNTGGVERVVAGLANSFAAQHHQVDVLCFLKSSAADAYPLDAHVGRFEAGISCFKQVQQSFSAVQYLRAHLRQHRYDHLLVSKPHNVMIVALAMIGLPGFCRPRVSVVLHEDACAVLAQSRGVKRAALHAIYRFAYPYADQVLAVSSEVAAKAAQLMHMRADSIGLVRNPIISEELEAARRAPPPHSWLAEEIPVFITVGRLSEEKNFALALEAFAQLKSPARLLMLGEGPERGALEDICARYTLHDRVQMLGNVAHPCAYMAHARALLLTSHHEALPSVVLEAMAMGLPVIATKCAAILGEWLSPPERGQLVPLRDVSALKAAMLSALSQPVARYHPPQEILKDYRPEAACASYVRAWYPPLNTRSLLIVTDSLAAGGAERVVIKLANALYGLGVKVELAITGSKMDAAPQLHPAIRITQLRSQRRYVGTLYSIFALARFLRSHRRDGLIAGIETLHPVAYLSSVFSVRRPALLGILHTTLSKHWHSLHPLRLSWMRACMQRMMLVAVSEAVARDAQQFLHAAPQQIITIANPIIDDALLACEEAALSDAERAAIPTVICVGGLKPMKRFDLAVRAFTKVRETLDCRMVIVGEGTEREALEALITSLNMAEYVSMAGYVPNPEREMLKAQALLLSSDYEGLPSVMIEALACGLHVVATDCPSGPREILEEGRLGTLVPVGDVDAMAQALTRALSSKPSDAEKQEGLARARAYSAQHAAVDYLKALGLMA